MTHSLGEFAVPLRTLDPADTDVSDLEPLRALIGSARVVFIGESAHLVREFYRLKDRMLRFLVRELGFSAFVMESGFAEGIAVNDWVLGGGGDLDAIARAGITYGFGDCEEMRAQLRWMRDWNATHDRTVRFYGMDAAGSCASPRPGIEACLARLTPRPEDAGLLELADLGPRMEALRRYAAMGPADRMRLTTGIAGLVERANASKDEIARRCALSVQMLNAIASDGYHPATGGNPREELMADNIRWILEREDRIVVGAHNAHIQRASFFGRPMLGQFLAPVLGKDMVVIGTTCGSGQVIRIRNAFEVSQPNEWDVSLEELPAPPPHTMEALMNSAGLALHLVDLRRVPAERVESATAMFIHHDTFDVDAKQAFDALVHVGRVSTCAGTFEALRDSITRAKA